VKESDAKDNSNLDNGESAADAPESLHLESMSLRNSIVSGFQIAANAGPLCDEPMWGLAFIVEPYIFADGSDAANHSDQYSIFSGQVITAVKEACRAAVLQNKPRLVEAMYFCELTAPMDQSHPTYAVLNKRRARILNDEMHEGTSLFTVHAYLPVAESVGFSNELRSLTAGSASALLVLSHWETIAEDPLFVPRTQDELEEHGDGSSIGPNLSKRKLWSMAQNSGPLLKKYSCVFGGTTMSLSKILSCCTEI
jgi:ribosome assembly protein 1